MWRWTQFFFQMWESEQKPKRLEIKTICCWNFLGSAGWILSKHQPSVSLNSHPNIITLVLFWGEMRLWGVTGNDGIHAELLTFDPMKACWFDWVCVVVSSECLVCLQIAVFYRASARHKLKIVKVSGTNTPDRREVWANQGAETLRDSLFTNCWSRELEVTSASVVFVPETNGCCDEAEASSQTQSLM